MRYIIPLLFIAVFACAAFRRVNVFSSFSRGVKEAVDFTLSVVPVLATVFIMCELFEASTLSDKLCAFLSPLFEKLGIPKGLTKLILIKPFSGSGSLAYLTEIIEEYGADDYVSRCACVLYGSTETVFYISAVYFAKSKDKKRVLPVVIILFFTFVSTILTCLFCRII